MGGERVLIGGVERRTIAIVPPDPAWAVRFAVEAERLRRALGAQGVRVEHVGSTAVPGLAAKPILDVQLSVPDVERDTEFVPALERAGYALRVREPRHRMLRTPARDVHLHVCSQGSDWEWRHLLFRDFLRAAPADVARYAAVKRELARRAWPDMNAYANAKTAVIAEITARAERWAALTGWRT